jgi:hypothetical protein
MFSHWSGCAYRDMLCLEFCNLFICMYILMHGVGSVRVDSITMNVDWFAFFLYYAHDMPIPVGITILSNYANEKRLNRRI